MGRQEGKAACASHYDDLVDSYFTLSSKDSDLATEQGQLLVNLSIQKCLIRFSFKHFLFFTFML